MTTDIAFCGSDKIGYDPVWRGSGRREVSLYRLTGAALIAEQFGSKRQELLGQVASAVKAVGASVLELRSDGIFG